MKGWYRLILIVYILHGLDSITSKAKAQAFNYFDNTMSANKNVIGFNLNQNFGTNSLPSDFVLNFLNGKFITNDQKESSIANFKDHEILAGEKLNLGFSYQRRIDQKNNLLYFEAGETFFYETRFHEDIFILLFKGNKSFENKTALLSPLRINSIQYLYLKTGFHKHTDRYSFKINLGYVGGQRLLDLETSRGGLFTATDGRFIDLDLKMKSFDAYSRKKSLLAISGNGVIADILASYKPSTSIEFGIGIEGIGVIEWQKNVTERIVDTMYHFDGVEIANVLDSFSIAIKNVEELRSSFIKENPDEKHQSTLPHIAYLHYSQFIIPEKLQIQLRYGVINSKLANPIFNSSVNYFFSPNKLIGLNIDAGGYSNWNVGAQFAINFSSKSSIHVYFNSISNLLSPKGEMNFTGGMIYKKAIF